MARRDIELKQLVTQDYSEVDEYPRLLRWQEYPLTYNVYMAEGFAFPAYEDHHNFR